MIPERCPLAESEQWSAYVDGNLDTGKHARAEEHLAACDECRATVMTIVSIKKRAKTAQVVPPAGVLESITREMGRRRFPWMTTGVVLLAASMLIAFGLMRRQTDVNTAHVLTTDVGATQSLRRTLSTLDDAITTAQAELAKNPDDQLLAQLLRDAQADKSRVLSSAQALARRSQ